MVLNILIILSGVILLPFLLYHEHRGNPKAILPIKTALSALFVIAVLIQPHPILAYYHLLLLALLFCLAGDVFLALPQSKMFLLGLVSFLVGHIFYIIGFFNVAHINTWTWMGTSLVLIFSGTVYFWLKPHLGTLKGPVIAYIIVITLMLSGAWSILGESDLAGLGRVFIFSGAIFFYVSDLFVARDRFVKKEPINRFLGLPLYYTGQFLLAFSVGHL
jgi:uncharacterized membrane protein YhhN